MAAIESFKPNGLVCILGYTIVKIKLECFLTSITPEKVNYHSLEFRSPGYYFLYLNFNIFHSSSA